MHVVDRVRCVLRHATNHNAVAPKKRAPTGDSPAEAQVGDAAFWAPREGRSTTPVWHVSRDMQATKVSAAAARYY